jgi:hypothetical protein
VNPKISVNVVTDNTQNLLDQIESLIKLECLVGVPAQSAKREDDEDKSGINNATIGYLNEHGSPAQNIPARPHLTPGVTRAKAGIASIMRSIAIQALENKDKLLAEKGLNEVGLLASTEVKKYITAGTHLAPLSDVTLAKRKADAAKRGIAYRTSPLIFTGSYVRSIMYVVRKRGETKDAVS